MATAYTNVKDVVPTFLELAGVRAPEGDFQGRKVAPVEGRSWVPYLRNAAARVYPADVTVAHELSNSRAVRQGEWKITDRGDGRWLLFNLASDPGETRDLSAAEPERKARLVAAYDDYARTVGVIPREDNPFAKIR